MRARTRRIVVVALLAIWYGVGCTNLLFAFADVIVPAGVASQVGAFPCASHACGCESEAKCRVHCCCSDEPQTAERAPISPSSRGVSFLAAARCAGHGHESAAGCGPRVVDHLPSAETPIPLPLAIERAPLASPILRACPSTTPPDKVPIAITSRII
ncbi:MAG: hypothetical protein HYR85_17400 [Planctomycetes bacterium]|nr:hypothetical protein [Planctomycetota bacterium]MBI3843438.1 hypothetical protein [Planctomycetota bacterium]